MGYLADVSHTDSMGQNYDDTLTPTLHSGIYMYFGTQGKQCIFSWHSRDTKAK